jgi:hypothetical protein
MNCLNGASTQYRSHVLCHGFEAKHGTEILETLIPTFLGICLLIMRCLLGQIGQEKLYGLYWLVSGGGWWNEREWDRWDKRNCMVCIG